MAHHLDAPVSNATPPMTKGGTTSSLTTEAASTTEAIGASGVSLSTSTESASSKGEEDDQNEEDDESKGDYEDESDPAVEPEDGESPSTTDQDRECKTNDEGPVKNKTCVFPFIYGEQIHHSCVEVSFGRFLRRISFLVHVFSFVYNSYFFYCYLANFSRSISGFYPEN